MAMDGDSALDLGATSRDFVWRIPQEEYISDPDLIYTLRPCQEAFTHDKPVSIFGVTTAAPETMTFLLGLGFRHFCVAPVALENFLASVGEVDLATAVRAVELARKVSSADELQPAILNYGHGRELRR